MTALRGGIGMERVKGVGERIQGPWWILSARSRVGDW